jgi:hypothetical protein
MPVMQVFKKYEVITADTAEQIGLSVTALLLTDAGWRLSAPMSCVVKPDGSLLFFVPMTRFECVTTPDAEPSVS